jgi:GT2 family glycosyltransferase
MGPDISVIVPVRDGEDVLPALLESLFSQTLEPERYEVVVVDNASRDRTAEVARSAGATVAAEPIPNRSRARNRGVEGARADLFAFTDADCVVSPEWLEAHLRCASKAPLVAGPVRVTTGEPPNAVERFERLWRFGQEGWVEQGWAATANLLVHRHAFEEVGGFDPTYRHIGEDADFCLRAGRAGLKLDLCPNAIVSHYAESSLRGLLKRSYVHGYSVNQCYYRLGAGYRAWRHPRPALFGDSALTTIGVSRDGFDEPEWRRMRRLARLSYAARIVGSLWAEAVRAR